MTNYEKAAEDYADRVLGPCDYMDRAIDEDITEKAFLAGCEHARPKWISVKERLPNFDTWCLVSKEDEIEVDHFGATQMGLGWTFYPDTITHWMPLPANPEGK